MILNESISKATSTPKCRAFYKLFSKSIGFLLFFFSTCALSATENQILTIQNAAQNYILDNIESPEGGKLEADANAIDSRIFATDCPAPLQTSSSSLSSSASSITVLVECPEDNWRIYVPVKLTKTGPQVMLVNSVNKGQLLNRQDVTIEMVDLLRFRRQGFSNVESVLGARAKKNLRPGEVLEGNDICVVCRNETVIIKAGKPGMTISTKGVALSDGAQGEQIRVKNSKSNRIIEARVTGIGEVRVQF
ncbi:flagellar basal body P-ring formation protein FlgA [Vibrio sp. AK197]